MTYARNRPSVAAPLDAGALERLRRAAPEVADAAEGAAAVAGRVPPGLGHALLAAILEFLEPDRRSGTSARTLFHHLGETAAGLGMSAHDLHAAQRIAVGAAVQRLTEQALEPGVLTRARDAGLLAERAIAYADGLKAAAEAGYAEAAHPEPSPQQRRLLTLLLRDEPGKADLRQAADRAGWRLPRTLAVVAVAPGSRRPARHLLPDVLAGPGCLVVPDPEGPGRAAALARVFEGVPSAIGPTVEPVRAAASLRMARHTLDLVTTGVVTAAEPVPAMAHVPDLMIMNDPEPVRRLVERRLAPLAHHGPRKRAVYAETLHAWFACGFNTTATAARLHVHAQTVRYRLRHLELIFGPDLHDPAWTLDYMIALRAWRLMSSPAGSGIWRS